MQQDQEPPVNVENPLAYEVVLPDGRVERYGSPIPARRRAATVGGEARPVYPDQITTTPG